ncbi:three-helix bundle dimerization domain-containing protein [Streptomyces sp. NPDC093094]|uniref:three-helix bundle dimerization domain-containing protein n=1 Tax=Streptomyces sp. NPDC093094 TaxID=3366026 RepID=UPI0038263199
MNSGPGSGPPSGPAAGLNPGPGPEAAPEARSGRASGPGPGPGPALGSGPGPALGSGPAPGPVPAPEAGEAVGQPVRVGGGQVLTGGGAGPAPSPAAHSLPAPPPSPAEPSVQPVAPDEALAARDLVTALRASWPSVDEAVIEAAVRDAYRSFRSARIRAFVPILVERRVRRALRESAGTQGGLPQEGRPARES